MRRIGLSLSCSLLLAGGTGLFAGASAAVAEPFTQAVTGTTPAAIQLPAAAGTSAADTTGRSMARSQLETAQQSVVKLFGAGVGNLDSYGSGVLISPEGHVLTVWNHLINTGYLTAVTHTGRRYAVRVVGTSRDHDLAVLQLQAEPDQKFPHIDLSRSVEADAGASVMGFSNMFHVATGNEPVSVVHGTIAIRAPLQAGQGRWQLPVKTPVLIVDAVTNNSGAAGGLLTLTDGTPVGLIGREIRQQDSQTWVNYAVPLTTLAPIADGIRSGRPPEPAAASTAPPPQLSDRQLTARFGITLLPNVVERTPAWIDAVASNSPAAQAGLRRGDLIVLLDDDVIASVTDVQQQLAARRPGQRVSITISRQQQLLSVELRIP